MGYKFNPLLGVGLDLNDGAQGPPGPEADAFKTIVAGNDTIVAEQADDTLTLVGGSNVTITGNAGTDTITIAAGGGGASALDDLSDVVITTPTNGQALKYNGTQWVNSTIAGGASALDDLTDVSVGGAVNGDFLRYDSAGGGQWIDSTAELNDLSDTTITSPTNGQVLKYDSVSSAWVNDTIAGGGGASALNDLTDVTITSASNGQGLFYDSVASAWVNDTINDAKIASNAEIAVSKLADGSARQLLQTDAAGTGVEWTSNVSVPGTLGVDGLTTLKNDLTLSDGASFTTTLQCITPTAARTVSIPDATGTLALVSGSSGQVVYNNAGAYAGVSTMTFDGTNITLAGRLINSYTSVASSPAKVFTGTWFTGGTTTTTKPHFLIEPTGTTSTAWSTSGTGLGVNAASGFAGNLLDLQVNGTSQFRANNSGTIFLGNIDIAGGGNNQNLQFGTALRFKFGSIAVLNSAGAEYTYTSLNLLSGVGLSWTSGTGLTSVPDLALFRDAANTLAQRNGTNAQTLRVYGTESSSLANHVRASLSCSSTAVTLAAESAGTGAADVPINLTAKGTGTVKVNSNLEVADAKDIVLGTTTGTKIGTATTQKLGFYNKAPVVQPTAVADITTTATAGTLPTPDGSVTIADAATPTVTELLEYCVELEAKLEAALSRLRDLGLIAT